MIQNLSILNHRFLKQFLILNLTSHIYIKDISKLNLFSNFRAYLPLSYFTLFDTVIQELNISDFSKKNYFNLD